MLDTRKAEGGGEWCGSFVGLTYVVTHSGRLMPTVEGDQHFFFDDSNTPQAQGTGTEEFAGGGDHWRWGTRSTLPLYGHPVGRMGGKKEDNPLELLNSAYRYLVADCFPFGKNAVIAMEHGIINNSREHYEGCAYWYGVHDAGLVLTDEVIVCDEANMRAHRAQSERRRRRTSLRPGTIGARTRISRCSGSIFPRRATGYAIPWARRSLTLRSTRITSA